MIHWIIISLLLIVAVLIILIILKISGEKFTPRLQHALLGLVLLIVIVSAGATIAREMIPKIEGVWRMEISALGVGHDENSKAYMEYEFYDGRGICINCVNGEIRSAEQFVYTLNGDAVTLEFPEVGPIRDYIWSVEGDVLTLSGDRGDLHLTKVERESVPYLADGYVEIHNLVLNRPR